MSNEHAPHDEHNRPAVGGPVEREVRPGAKWDTTRCAEFEKLEQLLNEVAAINNGSDFLGRIARCIELAKTLNRTDFDTGRLSFRHFLRECAIADRFGPRA